jgi:alpha-L-rhamnosidase
MDPALSDYRKADYYVTMDVTGLIHSGKNAIAAVLGNGRFYAPRTGAVNFGVPRLLVQLEITYADGSRQTVVSDRDWKVTDQGPIRANNEYDGEVYDARMAMPGWALPGYSEDSKRWSSADIMTPPGGTLCAQMLEPMRVTDTVRPIGISSPKSGTYIVDMGQTFYGTVRLIASAKRGTTVNMTSAYALLPDGTLKTADNRSARATDSYTFAGSGEETWNPVFKGQGFRRVQVTGFPGKPQVSNFEGLEEHTDVRPVGSFSCSNPLVNKIHRAMLAGMPMFLRSAPLDPDRDERQAWMGDPAKDSESEAYNFDVAAFYTKWMDDVRRSQRPDGTIPDVSMYWEFGSGVEWPSVFTIIPDWYTGFYADTGLAQKNYDAMKRWVLAMQRLHTRPDGTLEATSYGDWCDTYTIGGKIPDYGQTPRDLISTAYQYNNVRIVQRAAERMGRTDDAEMWRTIGDALSVAFLRKFFDPATNTYTSGTQCSYVLPLAFGLVPPDPKLRQAIIDNLVHDIMVTHDGHLTVGLIGNQWLLQVLTDCGRADVAWRLVTQTTRPSWGYMVGQGSDSIWERWDYDTRDPGMNSEALLIQAGNVDAWFYQTLGGINYDPKKPGFLHILIRPHLLGDLKWVKCSFNSPHGLIVSDWVRDGKNVTMNVTIPANTTATVTTPDGIMHEMASGSWTLKSRGE